MITPNDVKAQLMSTMPLYTDVLGTIVTDATAVVASGAVKITKTKHGLSSGDLIVGASIEVIVPVSDVTYDSDAGKATITTAFEHDRTSGPNSDTADKGGYNIAELQDFADDNYNGEFAIYPSASRTTILIDAAADAIGDLGNLIENRSLFLGFLTVTKIDANNFTVPLEDTTLINGTVFKTFNYTASQEIFISADITRAITAYAQRRDPSPALFIIFGEENASKDRDIINDAIAATGAQNPLHLTYIPEVIIMYMVVTKTEHSAATEQQRVYETIIPAVRSSLHGHVFEDPNSVINFQAHEVRNSPERWNTGYYIHSMTYNMPYKSSIEQGDVLRRNVSFRDIEVLGTMFDTEGALVSLTAETEI